MQPREIKAYRKMIRVLDENLEIKLAIIKYLMKDLIEQIYINKLNVERDM